MQWFTDRDVEIARDASSFGHRISVLALGTPAGTPLRDEAGQFLQQENGAIVSTQIGHVRYASVGFCREWSCSENDVQC